MTKILITTGLYPPEIGGPATYTSLLQRELPKRGIEVLVLPFRTVRYLPVGIRHMVYFFSCYGRARHVDVVYAQDTVSVGLPSSFAAFMAGKPFMLRVPGDYAWEQGVQRFGVKDSLDEFQRTHYRLRIEILRSVQRFVAARAALIIAPSKYLEGIIRGWVPTAPIHLVYNGIQLPEKTSVSREEKRIVSVGRLVAWKGFEELIEAASPESSWQLDIIGEGPEKERLDVRIREKHAEHRMRILPTMSREELFSHIRRAAVFVLYSAYEGLSHVLIEAAALGMPIVASDIAANREVLVSEHSGLLVPLHNPEMLRSALQRLMKNTEEARSFAARARESASHFSIEHTAGQLADIIHTLCTS